MTTAALPPTVTLEPWVQRRFSDGSVTDRYSLMHEGRAVLTFDTEFEARQAAKRFGWTIATAREESAL